MIRRTLAALVALGGVATAGSAVAGSDPPNGDGTAGPPYEYTTELVGQFPWIPLPKQALIKRTTHGYRYWSGAQDNHLVLTRTQTGALRFRDTGTRSFKRLAPGCKARRATPGVLAVCRVPSGISTSEPLLVEVWPRLGDDYVDGSSLPATFAMTVLADEGNDVARLGAGWDFFNGHTGRDRIWGGAGNDWVRAGDGPDLVRGGADDDQLVGMDGDDKMYGYAGKDRVGGNEGNDRLHGGSGADFVLCDVGRDVVWSDRRDRVMRDCETVK